MGIQIKRVCKEAEEEMTSLYTTHHFDFVPCENLIVFADHEKIGNVLNNLISNACKYSKKWEHNHGDL